MLFYGESVFEKIQILGRKMKINKLLLENKKEPYFIPKIGIIILWG
ncbi:hypothetical protein CBY_3494 [Clostridium butyricum 5521]|uniref:Uncharacterized protein n=1 Tax=Clostridium butyricum E4 str. BoNT E BL5262 TaxID=632245 RepID=C4IDC4_CLOBU|nr:hypothetical protein CBY_3494 [Clostridium butyricum 5521]EEP55329.1 hypothetical protein CLP_3353 [Clostridium butyricum E4 str. BoNT E BL5262]